LTKIGTNIFSCVVVDALNKKEKSMRYNTNLSLHVDKIKLGNYQKQWDKFNLGNVFDNGGEPSISFYQKILLTILLKLLE
jgi:hypothetical protein